MLELPDFYQSDQVGNLDPARIQPALALGAGYDLPPAAEDDQRTLLLLVDAQVDFIHPEGSLYVPGAVEDTGRTIEWLYRHLDSISAVIASLDSHLPLQIFYPTWWQDQSGRHPEPYTPITADQVEAGQWQPLFQPEWSRQYVTKLAQQAKKDLMIWPYHTMLGSQGHQLMPSLYEAVLAHSAARQAQPQFVIKGTIASTEYYSLLEPEVKVPSDPRGTLNRELLETIVGYDRIYVAGQAKSHCVLETLASVMRYYGQDEAVVSKFHLLQDCTSSVQHPEVDFDAMADETYQEFAGRGLQLVNSKDPL
jgi:nicotinamidase-related amidase